MKVGWCSSRCLALLLLALLEAVTLVFPQQQRCEDLTNTCSMLAAMPDLSAVATGMEFSRQMCSISVSIETGDMIDWYFTRNITENAIPIDIDGSKYDVDGELSQILIVNNISLSDEGYYFCRLRQNGGQTMPQQGTCLRVLAPAMFQTCEGNSNVPQRGCSETETLNATIGESVDFNIVLVHGGSRNESCNDQFIQMISLFKNDGPSSRITLTDCPSSACSHNISLMNRLKVSRTPNEFNIIVTLNNLTVADSGHYSAVADVRRPPNSMRMCMYKNFTLNVLENPSTNTPTTSGDTQSSISSPPDGSPLSRNVLVIIIVVIVVLVVLLIVLGVVVAGLLCWTYKNRHREKKGDMYETIKDVLKLKREKKKKSNGISLTEQDDTYQRRSFVEEGKMNLPEVWNSDVNQV